MKFISNLKSSRFWQFCADFLRGWWSLCYIGGGFYCFQLRRSRKTYLKPLTQALLPCKGLIESFFKFIKNSLSIRWVQNCEKKSMDYMYSKNHNSLMLLSCNLLNIFSFLLTINLSWTNRLNDRTKVQLLRWNFYTFAWRVMKLKNLIFLKVYSVHHIKLQIMKP